MDTGDAPEPMVGVEAVDIGKGSVVGSPTSVARRVLPTSLQQRAPKQLWVPIALLVVIGCRKRNRMLVLSTRYKEKKGSRQIQRKGGKPANTKNY